MKRLLIMSDIHCGHLLGLTPPRYHSDKFAEIQGIGYNFYSESVMKLKPDFLLLNGDIVDGIGHHDSTQHLTTDLNEQIDIAIECIEIIGCKNILITRGTGYHVKHNMETEDIIAKEVNATIGDSLKFDIEGLIFHARHTTGKGGTAYASVTSLQRSAVVTTLNDVINENEKADIFIRSHIHEYCMVQRSIYTAISTPCLQFSGTTFGRKCTGFYDYGLMWIDIEDKNNYYVHKKLLDIPSGKKERVIKL